MRDLDETDLEILRLLSEDSRRPYSDIAERVGLSAPAVSERVDRLESQGIIRSFTVDIDRAKITNRTPVVVVLLPEPAAVAAIFETLVDLDDVEHVFELADGSLYAHAAAPDADVLGWLRDAIDMTAIDAYEIVHLARYEWAAGRTATGFALDCVICENRVGSDGVTAEIDGEIKAFCCPSCKARYEERYESYAE